MDSEKLAWFRSNGKLLDPKFDRLAQIGDRKKAKENEEKLSIKYISAEKDKTYHYLLFEVNSSGFSSIKTANATLIEQNIIDDNSILAENHQFELRNSNNQRVVMKVETKKIDDLDPNNEIDGFDFKIIVTCDGLSAETEEFEMKKITDAKSGCTLTEPKAVFSKKLTLTEEQKSKFVATIYAETWDAKNQFEPFCWVYFNLVSRQGFEKGMRNSSAYKNESYQYKDGLKNYATGKIPSVNEIKKIVENKILVNKPLNPYPSWEGQGYYGDMNIRAPKTGSRRVWAYASQYFHLQNQCKVKQIWVKEFRATKKTSTGPVDITGYIYNFNEIEKYFNSHPKDLPDYEIGECSNDKLSPTQKNAIPAVYKIEPCQTNK